MFKRLTLSVLFIFACGIANAQTADKVYDQYLDFNMARFESKFPKALIIGESLLPNANKLPQKAKIIFYYNLGKLYEDNSQPDSAVVYYEKVLVAEPNYYVPHRALGYIYGEKVNEVYKQVQAGKADMAAYKAVVLKALPHLEKAQACDPSDDTLAQIKQLYTNIKDTAGLNSLNSRLTALSKNCVTVLSE